MRSLRHDCSVTFSNAAEHNVRSQSTSQAMNVRLAVAADTYVISCVACELSVISAWCLAHASGMAALQLVPYAK